MEIRIEFIFINKQLFFIYQIKLIEFHYFNLQKIDFQSRIKILYKRDTPYIEETLNNLIFISLQNYFDEPKRQVRQ